jgi:hypothetical protein
MFITSILPNPKSVRFINGSKLSPDRVLFLRMNMDAMKGRGWITDEEWSRGMKEWPVFGKPGVKENGSEDDDFIPSRDITTGDIEDEESIALETEK